MLAVQRISNSTSSSAHALPRASRAQAPKPIVKCVRAYVTCRLSLSHTLTASSPPPLAFPLRRVNLTERSRSMGLDSREGVVDTGGPLAMHRRRGCGVRSESARSHDEIPLPSLKSGLCSLSRRYGEEKRQYDEVLEKLLLHGQKESERPGSAGPDGEAHSSIELEHHETSQDFSSGDPNRFLNGNSCTIRPFLLQVSVRCAICNEADDTTASDRQRWMHTARGCARHWLTWSTKWGNCTSDATRSKPEAL